MLSLPIYHWLALAVVFGLTLIHWFSRYFTFSFVSERFFMSFSAGIGISYILIFMLPSITQGHELLIKDYDSVISESIYLIALLGFSIFYVMDLVIIRQYKKRFLDLDTEEDEKIDSFLFWAHIIFYMIYNASIGYSVTHYKMTPFYAIIIFLALGMHFSTNDWGLRHKHHYEYDKYGRKLLSLSILLGFLMSYFIELSEAVLSMMEAFLLGGMMINVIRRELPSEREGSLYGFSAAIITSALIFLLLKIL